LVRGIGQVFEIYFWSGQSVFFFLDQDFSRTYYPATFSTQSPPSKATNLGPEDQSKQISVSVWLNLHNQAALDARVSQMYDKSSANYHQF